MDVERGKTSRTGSLIAVVLISLVFFLLSFSAALQKSPTYDEPVHLFAGYAYLKWGDLRINPEHPPLAKALAALPLLAVDFGTAGITRAERDIVQRWKDYGWVLADRFFGSHKDPDRLFLAGKLVMIILAVILGVFVFFWARDLFGLRAGIVALAVYVLDPNILAHSSIVHTDILFSLCFFAGTYFFWRTMNRFTWPGLLFTSLFFALAAITKFSFLIILPVWSVLGILRVFSSAPVESQITSPPVVDRPWPKAVLLMVVLGTAFMVAYIVIWIAYGFRFDAVSYQSGQMRVGRLVSEEKWLTILAVLNSKYFLLPEAWVYGLIDAFQAFERDSYLLGEVSNDGSWRYFPIAFAAKTPMPTLLLIVCGLAAAIFRRPLWAKNLFLLVPVIGVLAAAIWSGLNIGLRHILPIYPFLFVFTGGAVLSIWLSKNWIARCGLIVLGIWLLVSSVRIYPDYLAFFNELTGGPENGHRILVDSNLDWGQDLKGLKRWMDSQKVEKLQFAYFGTIDPSFYGINAVPAPGSITHFWRSDRENSPLSPYIAISATYLAGLYLYHKDTYASFRDKMPIAKIGHSILIYRTDQ